MRQSKAVPGNSTKFDSRISSSGLYVFQCYVIQITLYHFTPNIQILSPKPNIRSLEHSKSGPRDVIAPTYFATDTTICKMATRECQLYFIKMMMNRVLTVRFTPRHHYSSTSTRYILLSTAIPTLVSPFQASPLTFPSYLNSAPTSPLDQ